MQISALEPGNFIYRMHETRPFCYFLLSGNILVFGEGVPQPLIEISRGASFSHNAPFTGNCPHTASLVAKTPVVVAALSYADFVSVARETPDDDARYLRRLIGAAHPFKTLKPHEFARLLSITKIVKLTKNQIISVKDKVAILCTGEVFGFTRCSQFPVFFGSENSMIPHNVLDEIKVFSDSATVCVISSRDFELLLVSDLSHFYDSLVRGTSRRIAQVIAKGEHLKMRPDFAQKENQFIADIKIVLREIFPVPSSELAPVAHAAWVFALRKVDELSCVSRVAATESFT